MAPRSTLTRDDAQALPAVGLRSVGPSNRLAIYAALGGAIGALPLPWVPESLLRRVRGALAHDVAVHRRVSLTKEARAALADPSGPDGLRGLAAQALRFVGIRLAGRALARLGPFALLWPLRQALRTYVLGHLFDRYLERGRAERAVRVDLDEARRVRRAIDGALMRAITIEGPPATEPTVIDEQRDAMTALIDGLIGVTAGLPDRLVSRLDAAFDDLIRSVDG
jgi:hypothetical protein